MKVSVILSALVVSVVAAPAPSIGYGGFGGPYLPHYVDTAPEVEHMSHTKLDNERGPYGKLYPETYHASAKKTGFDHSIVTPWIGHGGYGGFGHGIGHGIGIGGYGKGFGHGIGHGIGHGNGHGKGLGHGIGHGKGLGKGLGKYGDHDDLY